MNKKLAVDYNEINKKNDSMEENLKKDIISILEYFDYGLGDVEAGSGEKQPMHEEIKSALERIKKDKVTLEEAIESIKSKLEVKAGRLCEPILKQGGNPRNDKECKEVFMALSHLAEVENYVQSKMKEQK